MKMRTFAVLMGMVTAACCLTANFMGCVVTTSGGTGGEPGTGGSGGGTASSSSSSSVSSTSSGMACDMNLKCGAAVTAGGDPARLCAGSASEMLYKTYHDCVCAAAGCMAECMTTVCAMKYMPADMMTCSPCVTMKCKTEADNCNNDL